MVMVVMVAIMLVMTVMVVILLVMVVIRAPNNRNYDDPGKPVQKRPAASNNWRKFCPPKMSFFRHSS